MRVIVVGAGVVGLSCAVRLLEDGHRVDVVARDLPLETTSRWRPRSGTPTARCPRTGSPPGRRRRTPSSTRSARRWSSAAPPSPGCGWSRARRSSAPPRTAPGGARRCRTWAGSATCPRATWTAGRSPRRSSRCRSTCAGWSGRLEELGGTLTRLNLRALPEGADLVVNCSGLGARLLGEDRTVVPVRGQVRLRRAGRARPLVARRRRADVRRAARARHRGRRDRRGGGVEPDPLGRAGRRDPVPRLSAGARAAGGAGAAAQGRPAAGAARGATRAGRPGGALLRARRCRRDVELGRGRHDPQSLPVGALLLALAIAAAGGAVRAFDEVPCSPSR